MLNLRTHEKKLLRLKHTKFGYAKSFLWLLPPVFFAKSNPTLGSILMLDKLKNNNGMRDKLLGI